MLRRMLTKRSIAVAAVSVGVLAVMTPGLTRAESAPATKVSGGHVTKTIDKGRPVVLVASALGVPEAVFREAFSKVTPAPAGSEPEPGQVDENKEALLSVLAPYGVTNDDLDRVSNHYRYNGSASELWPVKAAVLRATMRGGKVVGIRVISGGSGYTSAPRITVSGHPEVIAKAKLAFDRTFTRNGRITSVKVTTRRT
jgi:hypothetical protein